MPPRTAHRPALPARLALLAPLATAAAAACSSDACPSVAQVGYSAPLVDGEVAYVVHAEALQLPLAAALSTSSACVARLDAETRDDALAKPRLTIACHEAIGADVSLEVILPVDLRTIPADGSPHAVALPRQEVRRFTVDAGADACFDGWADASASVTARDARGSLAPFPAMVSADWTRTIELELHLATPATSVGPKCAGPEGLVLRATVVDAQARYATAVVPSCWD